MANTGFHVVTGAFGFSGSHIASRLLLAGRDVRTLTNSPDRPNPFKGAVKAFPLAFDDMESLTASLHGAMVLYNTYWVRFNADRFSHENAVENTLRLFEAAKRAGVLRNNVHTSITHPSPNSPFEYFRGKARLEEALKKTGISHSILRPAVLFGKGDILINNIAWAVRRLPVIGIFGDGNYRLRPIHVEDYARLNVEHGMRPDNVTVDAVGPEDFRYRELVALIARALGKRRLIMRVPTFMGVITAKILGAILGDIMLTREEVGGLMAGLLSTDAPSAGTIRLSEWARANASTLGMRYHSELARRRNRKMDFSKDNPVR